MLWIVVDNKGNVSRIDVVKPLDKGLDKSAVETVRTWKFKPGTRNGVPIPIKVMVEITFRL